MTLSIISDKPDGVLPCASCHGIHGKKRREYMPSLAAYYVQQPEALMLPTTSPELANKGARLASRGDDKRGIAACSGYHGEKGESGITPATSALFGQIRNTLSRP